VPLAGVGLALTGSLALAVAAASAHGSPLSPGRQELTDLPGVVFLSAAGCAFALYILALVLIRRHRSSVALVCVVAAATQLIPLAGPLLLSRDVYAYWTYGRLVSVHDANPYTVSPSTYASDPGEHQMARLALATGLLVLASPWVLPWYAVWIVPLAAVEEDRLAWVLARRLRELDARPSPALVTRPQRRPLKARVPG
jgi:hypothetical protein